MFAGKSTELLRRVAAHEAAGRSVLVFASARDTRYAPGGGAVATHTGALRPTPAAGPTLAAAAAAAGGDAVLAAADVLAIDEAQFFPDLVSFASTAADERGQTVVVAGLDGDFARRPFGGLPALLPHADCVTKLAAACAVCGGPAHFSVRLGEKGRGGGSGPQVEVGGAERYAAVCRAHYRAASVEGGVAAAGRGGGEGAASAAPPATV
jgi:thymidine kinase